MVGVGIHAAGVEPARSLKLPGHRLRPLQFGVSAAVACATAIVATVIGLRAARRLLAWWATYLVAHLVGNDRG